MIHRKNHRRGAAIAAAVMPVIILFNTPNNTQATTGPAPGVEAPQHVMDHAKRSQVSLDTPGGWRGKAKTAKAAREAGLRSMNAVTGVLEVPVICFGYDNRALPANTVADLQQELFDGPWPTGTLSDYYNEISFNKFTFDGTVFDVGNLANNDNVYEGGQNGISANLPYVYVNESLTLADATVNFADYDNDGPDGIPNSGDDDCIVDLVALVHPEIGGECGNANIWSHRWTYASANWYANNSFTRFVTSDASANGGMIEIDDYTIMPSLSCGNSLIEIGVFCHEFGHALGLPDLYGTNGSINAGCGYFCLMASGNWNQPDSPGHMSAWCRAEMGWVQPQLVIGDYTNLTIPAAEAQPFALKIQHDPDSSEYLLIENRQPIGFDQNLLGCGLAIWHVDPAVGSGNDNGWCGGAPGGLHSFIALEQSDGLCEMENWGDRGDADDLWSANGPAFVFDGNSFPNSRPYSGVDTGVSLSNLSACGDPMTIDLSVNPLPITEARELDVLFIFDISGSYWDDMPEMLAQMPSVMSEIANSFPNPNFAVASFKDFPMMPVGGGSDFAWNVDLDFNSNSTTVLNTMSSLSIGGGLDLPESQYEAVWQAITGSGLDLNNDADFTDTGEIAPQPLSWDANRAPIIFLMTDADFHDADGEDYPPGAGQAHGRNALLNELATPTVMAETPRIFTLNAEWAGPTITDGAWGHGESHDPVLPDKLHRQATELGDVTGGRLFYAGANTVDFLDSIMEALSLIEGDIASSGTCCTTDGECISSVTFSWCMDTVGGVWSDNVSGCNEDCNQNNFPDSCEIALGITPDANGNGIPDVCECVGDVDRNGVVNVDDMLKIIGSWGCGDACDEIDLNQDGLIDINDLLIVFDGWGECGG